VKKEIVIKVDNVYKIFKIPHERDYSLKSATLNLFKKKKYTNFIAANGISFEIEKGDFFGIVGRNGSGKSTMLKMLAGIYLPDKGKIISVGRLSPFLELGVGFNPELTGRENVYLNGVILGLTRKEIDEKYNDIVAFAELEEFMDQKLKNYSSGMQVRLAFSVAIQAHSDIILIDEVLAVGDSRFQHKCFSVFQELKKAGKTIVFVSHSMDVITKFCNKAILLHNGIIFYEGTPEKVAYEYERLNNDTQASDQGSKNRWGNKNVEITDIKYQIGGEQIEPFFSKGDKFDICFYYKNNLPKNIFINLAMGVYRAEDRTRCFGLDTVEDGIKIKLPSSVTGMIKINFKMQELLPNSYALDYRLYGESHNDVFDAQVEASKFVISGKVQNAIIKFNYKINHEIQ